MRNAHNVLVVNPGGKQPLRRPRHKWGIILKKNLNQTQHRDQWPARLNTALKPRAL
jgi:hypothetical protein